MHIVITINTPITLDPFAVEADSVDQVRQAIRSRVVQASKAHEGHILVGRTSVDTRAFLNLNKRVQLEKGVELPDGYVHMPFWNAAFEYVEPQLESAQDWLSRVGS